MSFDTRVLVALSGGVDSSLALAVLKKAGYDTVGATMCLHAFSAESDGRDAAAVAAREGVPFHTLDLHAEFDRFVIRPFIECYERGGTPNPCVACNRYLKFGALLAAADRLGCEKLATGHYARIEKGENGKYLLKKPKNRAKDQTYVLYTLTQETLSRVLFPLGDFASKDEVRAAAEEYGIPVADKKDSQDICFIPNGDYVSFIENYTKKSYPAGDFLDENGNVLGRHKGIIRYTVGQRKGLGLSLPAPLYVSQKDVESNTVTLAGNDALGRLSLTAKDFNWISGDAPTSPIRVKAKTRYNAKETDAVATVNGDGSVTVEFNAPERAVTRGQSVVLYDGDTVLGGGIIQ